MKPTFEDCITHIETTLGCKLLDWQKDILYYIYKGKSAVVYRGRGNGKMLLYKAEKILKELMKGRNKQ